MTRLVRRAAASVALIAASLGATLAVTVATATPAAAAVTWTTTDTTLEDQVTRLINTKRAAYKCAALRTDQKLRNTGRLHSADMVTRNFFSHTGSNGSNFVTRATRSLYTQASAENIAWGYRTADSLVNAWMNSPVHRANILNCANRAVGIGIAKKTDGTPYWTQVFGRV